MGRDGPSFEEGGGATHVVKSSVTSEVRAALRASSTSGLKYSDISRGAERVKRVQAF